MVDGKHKFVCDRCNFRCKFESRWLIHVNTSIHQTGKKKLRSDYKGPHKCDKCDYESINVITFKKHVLNCHSTKEDRESQFKFYCGLCDFGTFSNDTMELHKKSNKHKRYTNIYNKN